MTAKVTKKATRSTVIESSRSERRMTVGRLREFVAALDEAFIPDDIDLIGVGTTHLLIGLKVGLTEEIELPAAPEPALCGSTWDSVLHGFVRCERKAHPRGTEHRCRAKDGGSVSWHLTEPAS